MQLLERLFGEDNSEGPLAVAVLLRKFYSIVAFALIGYVVDKALPPTRRPALRAALIVALFSAIIEIVQKQHHAHEGRLSNLFDIACGAFGGWLAVAPRTWRLRRRSRS